MSSIENKPKLKRIIIPQDGYGKYLDQELYLSKLDLYCDNLLDKEAKIAVSNILSVMEAIKLDKMKADYKSPQVLAAQEKKALKYANNLYCYLKSTTILNKNQKSNSETWLTLAFAAVENKLIGEELSLKQKQEVGIATLEQTSDYISSQVIKRTLFEDEAFFKRTIKSKFYDNCTIDENLDIGEVEKIIKFKDLIIESLIEAINKIKFKKVNILIKTLSMVFKNINHILDPAQKEEQAKKQNFFRRLIPNIRPIDTISFFTSSLGAVFGIYLGLKPELVFIPFSAATLTGTGYYIGAQIGNVLEKQIINSLNSQYLELSKIKDIIIQYDYNPDIQKKLLAAKQINQLINLEGNISVQLDKNTKIEVTDIKENLIRNEQKVKIENSEQINSPEEVLNPSHKGKKSLSI
jgi:hypothetical protein